MIVLLFIPILVILIAAGRTIATALKIPESASLLDRNLIGYAIGLVLFAYTILAVGLFGGLYPVAGWVVVLVFAVLGIPHFRFMAGEAKGALRSAAHPGIAVALMIVTLVIFGCLALVGVLTPPVVGIHGMGGAYTEWDSISYHLADPRLYVQHHRIFYIPWDHHSNFAFTAEMWYTWALLVAKSSALAKMFHWSCALAAALAIYRIGQRHVSTRAGVYAAVLFLTTPLVFWEAGTAYVDLTTSYFISVTLLAYITGLRENDDRWLWLSAVLMGCTLSTKATSVIPLTLLAAGLLVWKLILSKDTQAGTGRALGLIVGWCAVALVIGSPWYVKSYAYTGNPVYPFYYKLLGGRDWSPEAASAYDASNHSFGLGHGPRNLLLSPWDFTMFEVPGHDPTTYPFLDTGPVIKPFNDVQTEYGALSPVFLAALFAPLLLFGFVPRLIKALSVYLLLSWLLWFATMQYNRYALAFLPVICLLAGWTVDALLARRAVAGRALAGLTVLSAMITGYFAVRLAAAQAPVAFGAVSPQSYIEHGFIDYDAIEYVNALPGNGRVVFYGVPFGYYCDKPYLWGESNHSTMIPYARLHGPSDLLAEYHRLGIEYVLVDPRSFSFATDSVGYPSWVYALTAGRSQPLFVGHSALVFALPEGS